LQPARPAFIAVAIADESPVPPQLLHATPRIAQSWRRPCPSHCQPVYLEKGVRFIFPTARTARKPARYIFG
jgi:hypothetical protein